MFEGLRRVRHWPPVITEFESHRMNSIGQFLGLGLPPTDATIAEIAPRVRAMGFDLFEMGVENPGDWGPARVAEILAANDLGASVCAVMGEGRDLLERDDRPYPGLHSHLYRRGRHRRVERRGRSRVPRPARRGGWTTRNGPRPSIGWSKGCARWPTTQASVASASQSNRSIAETSFLNTAAQTMEVVDRVDSPAVGVLLDTFHMNIEEKDQAGHPPRR